MCVLGGGGLAGSVLLISEATLRPDLHLASPLGAWGTIVTQQLLDCCCKGEGISIIYPRQINKPVRWPRYAQQSEGGCHPADSVILGMVSIPERTKFFKANWKNKSDSLVPPAKITPSTHLSKISWEMFAFPSVTGNVLQCWDFLYPHAILHNLGNLYFVS